MDVETLLKIGVLIIGFYMAWNIGANDVSNAVGTSVGSGALTIRRAVVFSAIFEFSGAFFVGSNVAETMQHGLIDTSLFLTNPMMLILGMCGALLGTGVWLQIASYFGWPVSTTHAIVGAILGFGVMAGGFEAILWGEVLPIATSWVLSPLMSGIISYLIFSVLQHKILYAMNPIDATRRLMPLLTAIVFGTFTISLLVNGLKNLHLHISFIGVLGIAVAVAGLAAISSFLYHGRTIPKRTSFTSDFQIVEKMFISLQVLSACFVAFAHGANDVANAVGPISAVLDVLKNGTISETTRVPLWLLALGGLGIVIGLATWGWRVIITIGKKITELTPTRGFCAEFGAATTILIASKLGLPISTTHCLVGAVLGVGLARGMRAINLNTLKEIVLSWIVTIPMSALMSVLFYYGLKSLVTLLRN